MRAVLQRTLAASVEVDGRETARIGKGLAILLGVCVGDGEAEADKLAEKTAELRIFEDGGGKLNLSLLDVGGAALVVSNFTLYGDCSHGRRPSFIRAERPERARALYERYIDKLREHGVAEIGTGVFGADMRYSILNDGPVTVILDTAEMAAQK